MAGIEAAGKSVSNQAGFFKQQFSQAAAVAKGFDDFEIGQQRHQGPVVAAKPRQLKVLLLTDIQLAVLSDYEGIDHVRHRFLLKGDQHQQTG